MSNRTEVIQDEADAEKRYLAHIEQAKIEARNIANNQAHAETKRVAAAEAEAALERIEEARERAEQQASPVAAKRTFLEWLRGV